MVSVWLALGWFLVGSWLILGWLLVGLASVCAHAHAGAHSRASALTCSHSSARQCARGRNIDSAYRRPSTTTSQIQLKTRHQRRTRASKTTQNFKALNLKRERLINTPEKTSRGAFPRSVREDPVKDPGRGAARAADPSDPHSPLLPFSSSLPPNLANSCFRRPICAFRLAMAQSPPSALLRRLSSIFWCSLFGIGLGLLPGDGLVSPPLRDKS